MSCQPLGEAMRLLGFITLFGAVTAGWPVAARAQQPTMQTVGVLGSDSPDQYADRLRALRQGLRETGYIEGQNLAIEYRCCGRQERCTAGIGVRLGSITRKR